MEGSMKRESLLHWYPVLLRYGGLTGCLIFVPAVWLATNRLEPALIAMFMSMVGIGEGVDALRDFTQNRPPEGPPLPQKVLPSEDSS